MVTMIRIVRAYDEPQPGDGARVLVDRLWPRGLAKDAARIDLWCKEVAPSTELRRWYGHRPERFADFTQRYRAELNDQAHGAAVDELRELAARGTLTLLTATKDLDLSHTVVLAPIIEQTAD